MRKNAKTEHWTPMEIRGVIGYFNDLRIDRSTVPSGFHFWELADGDCDGTPCRYKPGILVNFYGTFITAGELPIDCPECQEGFINSDEEWGYMDCSYYSLAEIVEMEWGMWEVKQEKKGLAGMKIQKFSVVLDGDGRNILEEDFSRDYDGSDRLDTPAKIVAVMEEVFHLSDRAEEYMYLICMNARCKPICLFEVSHGTHDSALVGIREIFVRVLLCGASDIVVVHNHPDGLAEPTGQDLRVTERIKEASDLMGILLCDHIIISRDSYFSFRENGKIGKSVLQPDGLDSSFLVARTGN